MKINPIINCTHHLSFKDVGCFQPAFPNPFALLSVDEDTLDIEVKPPSSQTLPRFGCEETDQRGADALGITVQEAH